MMLSARYDCMTQLKPPSFPPLPGDASMEAIGRRIAAIEAHKQDPFPESDGCVNVNLSAAGKVRTVNVRIITFKPALGVATRTVQLLDPAKKLSYPKTIALEAITPPGHLDVTYSNNLGDALTIITEPDISGIVVRLHNRPVSSATFH
jgi:hypothetical protein